MIKKNKKTETVGIRLSRKLREEMDAVKELYGLSLSNQFVIAIRTFHKTLNDEQK
jgi:antitoxin component of RelBE/YafQ-DinJ toxin-antitoxin module